MDDQRTKFLSEKARTRISRRDFMRTAANAGLGVALASSIWEQARAQTPRSGGRLRLGADGGSTTDTFNQLEMNGSDNPTVSILSSFDTLTEIDENGSAQPSLAESWEGTSDGTWVIALRKGVEFHDGKTLTADDVVWSLRQHLSENNRVAEAKAIVENLEEIRSDGPDRVILKQREVNFDLPIHLSAFAFIVGQEGNDNWSEAVGTGP